ncbi:MAG: hypothetical protein JO112_04325, partial [Planctomycetes bacterium]|nr:hypothetical protein [Planctomycetota bacterium]
VATAMKGLDGSREYPLHVAEVIDQLRKRYRSDLEQEQQSLNAALDQALKVALQGQPATGPRESTEVMYVTWMPEAQQLQVRFRTTFTDGAYQYGHGIEPAYPIDPPGRGSPARRPPGPGQGGVRFGTQVVLEWGKSYEVSKTGQVVRTLTLPPRTVKKILPPPA